MQTLKLQEWVPKTRIWCITFNKKNSRKNYKHSFSCREWLSTNKKINFVIFYNDLCIPLNSNPKYRRKVAYGKIKQDIANILSMLCKRKGVKIVEAEICPDHVHMLVEIPPSISVSYFVGYLKGKSTLMIFERHANLKYKYGNRHFWCRGYYVDTVGKKCEENSGIYS